MSIISRSLEKVIRRVATCNPKDTYSDLDWQIGRLQFRQPYRFVYHHRTLLLEHAKICKPSVESQISALLGYVEGAYGVRYGQADALFCQGKTNRSSLEFLFCPFDILLSCTKGIYTAHTLSSWPEEIGLLHLYCWGWTFDGLQFRRTRANLTVRTHDFDGAIPIQELPVYPMRYAPQDLCSHLKSRGQRFWNLIRFQNYVSYTGWDVMKDENHVRYSFDTSS